MVYTPPTLLGRGLLGLIIAVYLLLLLFNLLSFGGPEWITYTDYNVEFGLWRVCYGAKLGTRTCNQWSGSQTIIDTTTNATIFSGKPNFVQSAEGLEIVSLIFYIFAGIFIILGIIDLEALPLETMFIVATSLLFLTIIFLSAALGVMSVQGRADHPGAYLEWSWWIGLLGLIVTIICVAMLIVFIIDLYRSGTPATNDNMNISRKQKKSNISMPTPFGGLAYPPQPVVVYPFNNQWAQGYPYPYPYSYQNPYPPSPQPFYPNNLYPGYDNMYQPPTSPLLAALTRQQFDNRRQF